MEGFSGGVMGVFGFGDIREVYSLLRFFGRSTRSTKVTEGTDETEVTEVLCAERLSQFRQQITDALNVIIHIRKFLKCDVFRSRRSRVEYA